jgi:hypothetical protein
MNILNWLRAKSSPSAAADCDEISSQSDSNDELVNSYIELAGVASDQPSHGLAMREYLRSANPGRESEVDEIGKKFQAAVDAAELKGAKRGAEFVARRLSGSDLAAAVHCFETVGYRRFNQIAVAVEHDHAISEADRQVYNQQSALTWMQNSVRLFREWTANPAHIDDLHNEVLEHCNRLDVELAANGLQGPQSGSSH